MAHCFHNQPHRWCCWRWHCLHPAAAVVQGPQQLHSDIKVPLKGSSCCAPLSCCPVLRNTHRTPACIAPAALYRPLIASMRFCHIHHSKADFTTNAVARPCCSICTSSCSCCCCSFSCCRCALMLNLTNSQPIPLSAMALLHTTNLLLLQLVCPIMASKAGTIAQNGGQEYDPAKSTSSSCCGDWKQSRRNLHWPG